MKLIDSALDYLARGVSIIPVDTDKRPLVQWSEFQKRTPTEEEVRGWWSRWPDAGIALVCGRVSRGVVVLDVDPRNGGTPDGLPPTGMRSRTGGGGFHLFYRYLGDRPFPKQWRQGVDIKTDGGYVILPPSQHASGNAYEWIEEGSMGELPDPPAGRQKSNDKNTPGWVATLLANGSPEGNRNNDCARLAGYLANKVTQDIAEPILFDFGSRCSPPIDHEEILRTVSSVYRTAATRPPPETESTAREPSGEPPENPPPPTDEDKNKDDPRRSGGPLDPEQDLSFRVSRIKKIDSRPAVYHVQIDGAYDLRVNRKELRSVEMFSEIYFEELDKEPLGMPAGKGKNIVWRELVTRWMRKPEAGGVLEVQEQPDESSEGGLIRHTLREILDDLAVGETVEDLDHSRVLAHDDGFLVKQLMLLKAVKHRTGITTIKTEQISEELRHDAIGAVFKRLRVDGRQVRVWFFQRASREKEETEKPDQLLIH